MHSWPHAPSKLVTAPGIYMVTAATYLKSPLFDSTEKLTLLQNTVFETCMEYDVELQAWAIFPNHYHLIGFSPEEGVIQRLTGKIHGVSARALNKIDDSPGRKVWQQSWDTRLSYQNSYLARLSYVHNNPSRHGCGPSISYPFCSAHWFETMGDRAFIETVKSIPYDRVEVEDDF